MTRAVKALQKSVLDPNWSSFNFDKILPEQPDALVLALNQAVTPPFGTGGRFVWLANSSLVQRCSADQLQELERTLPKIPDTTTLLLTSPAKLDARLKFAKLLKAHGTIQEFTRIPPWKTDQLQQQVRKLAQQMNVPLTPTAVTNLTEAVGNDTSQLYNELEKLKLYSLSHQAPLDEEAIATLVSCSQQNSLKLATAIKSAQTAEALDILNALLQQNEAGLRIVSTLVSQFRTWLWVKLLIHQGIQNEQEIAKAAEVSNPRRIYFLRQEVQSVTLLSLQQTLPHLLDLELNLKQGAQERSILQTKVIELCRLFNQ